MTNANSHYLLRNLIAMLLVLWCTGTWAQTRIGGLLFSNEARYSEALTGFKDALHKAGYTEANTYFVIENAQGNKAKAVELVKKLSADKLDLIFTVGTSATAAVSRTVVDVPVVFSVVYDPVAAGIAKSWTSSDNNTTGISTQLPMSQLMDVLKRLVPVKKLAVLYTPGEKNSEAALADLQKIQDAYQIKMVPVRLTSADEVQHLLPTVLQVVDAVYVTGSNLVDSQLALIADLTAKAKIPTITHLEDLVERGVLIGVCADSYAQGQDAGAKAIKILKGAKPSSLSIDKPKTSMILLNMQTAQKGKFAISDDFIKTVTRKIE
ncbi:MAG: ABC transporter substrate-binding protein [Rhodoferax sp.]|nr:ABC transporter substrate-binding protein [Rhodoferax sp.]